MFSISSFDRPPLDWMTTGEKLVKQGAKGNGRQNTGEGDVIKKTSVNGYNRYLHQLNLQLATNYSEFILQENFAWKIFSQIELAIHTPIVSYWHIHTD